MEKHSLHDELLGLSGRNVLEHVVNNMTAYRNRRAVQIENETLRLTVLVEGGHLAEAFHKPTRINPLWTPPWPSIEPSTYDAAKHPEYGRNAESKLLAGLMGHNLCMDIFGGPSEEEAAAGITVHGEASVVPYDITAAKDSLTQRAEFPQAQLRFSRKISLDKDGVIGFEEEVENLAALDRPIAWTQHVTLGDPFVEPGVTQFRASATKSKVIESDFTGGKGYMKIGAEFDWPHVPSLKGGSVDMQVFPGLQVSGAFSTHLMNPKREDAFFMAWSPKSKLLIGYMWKRADFPWLGIWEENHCRTVPPWNGKTITRGMEFGVSPMPETRRQMIERSKLFGVPGYRWIPARKTVRVAYHAFLATAEKIPDEAPA
jgi:hypothetical protein